MRDCDVFQGSRYGVQPSGCTDVEQAKACTPCQTVGYFKVVGMEFILQAALTLGRAKACTPCQTVVYFKVVGMEFSLQAALTLSRLKPVLHARLWVFQGSRFGVQPSGCTDFEQAKACTPCQTVGYFKVVGMEFSLQAALTLSRLKPVLHARLWVFQGSRYGVQPSGCADFEQAKACTPCETVGISR